MSMNLCMSFSVCNSLEGPKFFFFYGAIVTWQLGKMIGVGHADISVLAVFC